MSDNAKYLLKVVLSILTLGVTWIYSNQAAIITAVTIVIVWILNSLFKWKGIKLGRAYVTGILYVIAFLLVVLFNPGVLPTWPIMPTDAGLAISVITAYLQMVIVALIPYAGAAMTIYNMLMQDVLDKVPVSLLFRPAPEQIG